jgi:LuxR family transcriptional regulator, maltose regulon positive regulatory protein
VDQLLDVARHDGRNLDVITLTIWRALALQVLGQEDAAADALGVAVVLAAPQHCVRPFLDVGPAVGRLLQQPALRSIGGDFTVALLDELAAGVQGSQPRASARASRPLAPARPSFLIEPLSSRELDVLRLIAEGLSNKEIAGRLLIGVGTVKWYATTIYSKLDVGSRTQAVARAQELGLLS